MQKKKKIDIHLSQPVKIASIEKLWLKRLPERASARRAKDVLQKAGELSGD